MPPSSRRKKKYEQQLRTFQNRNVFAGIALLIAVAGAVWLAITLAPSKRPTVYLRTNMIDHSGSKEIPLAQESCKLILDTFRNHMDEDLLNWEETHELDQKDSSLILPKSPISDNDVLVVYLNGHLVSQENELEPVAFLVPEVDREVPPQDLGSLLEQIEGTKAGLKILLLDAGRFTSSPVYPARKLNEFNSALSKALKPGGTWGDLGNNLWIIVSHEDHEVSRVSTPLKSSLFAKAFTESIEQYARDDADEISVFDLFEQIRKRTTSWSRNFKRFSTQHPVLMRSGYGRVDFADPEELAWPVLFNDQQEPPEEGKNTEKEPRYVWTDQFASTQSGALTKENLLAGDRYDAIPLETIRQLEGFLELGSPINSNSGKIAAYRQQLKKSSEKPEENYHLDIPRLNRKQQDVSAFRKSVLGLSLFERFQNELRHWEDDPIMSLIELNGDGSIRTLQPFSGVKDIDLTKVEDTPPSYLTFTSEFGDYRRKHSRLIERVNGRLRRSLGKSADDRLTPTEAEMLGRVSQRYLPLLAGFEPKTTTDPQDESKKSEFTEPEGFGLDLTFEDSTTKFGSKDRSVADLYSASSSGAERPSGSNDTSFRFLLAAVGSENLDPLPGVVPAIEWEKITPQILLSTESNSAFRLNPSDLDPIHLQVEANATELVKLSVEFGDGELPSELDTMEFGFDPVNFEKSHSVSIGANEPVKLYVEYSNPVGLENWIGKEIPFVITAQGGDAKEEQITIPVIFIRDPIVQFIAKRELGASGKQSVMKSSLVRWGAVNLPAQWRPLMLKSLGNIESKFTFWLKNNSSTSKSLSFTLYNLIKPPAQVVQPDLIDKKAIEQLARWLANRMVQEPSATPIDLPQEYFKTFAIADSLTVDSGEEKEVKFKAWVAEGQKLTDEIFNPREVDKGMLLVGRDNDGQLAWFQWVGFEPQEAADGTSNLASSGSSLLKLRPDILDVFQADPADENQTFTTGALLKDLWPAPGFGKEEPAARLISVPADGGFPYQITHQNTLTLESLMDGQELSKKTDLVGKHLLIVDLFGVCGYRLLSQDDGRVTRSFEKDQLAGIRVKPGALPGQWKCHPKTWSLFGFGGEERSGDLPTKTVFIHKPKTEDANQVPDVKLEFEFLLPRWQGEVLGNKKQNFEIRFNGGRENLTFPNNRKHFIRTREDGLSFFTKVTAHSLVKPSSNFADGNELTIFDKQRNQVIAKWKFRTSSKGNLSGVSLVNTQSSNARVKLDVSQIQPPIDLSRVSVSVGDRALDDSAEFLSDWRDGASGRFKFPWSSLAEALELKTEPGDYKIQLAVKDFFGKEHRDSAQMTIKPPPKPKKIKQKKITKRTSFIKLKLVDSDGKALDVKSIDSLEVDQQTWPVSTRYVRVTGWVNGKQIKVYGLGLGQHNVRIAVKVQSEKIANGRDSVALEASIEVASDKQVIPVTRGRE